MARSSGFPQQVADLLARHRLPIQGVGLVLGGAGFGGRWWLAPTNMAAQLSAALVGVSIGLFAQFFVSLRNLKPEERRSLELAGAGCFVLCLAATVGATGYHWVKNPRVGGPMNGGPSSGAPGTEVTFAAEEPNRLVIRAP